MSDDHSPEIERRKHFRLDMEKEMIDITWTSEDNQEVNKKVVCIDFSRGGAKIDCDYAIPVNTVVTLIFRQAAPQSQKLQAKVIRCVKQDTGWFDIGLLLLD